MEFWQEAQQRNLDTCGIWSTFAPTFEVGEAGVEGPMSAPVTVTVP